MEKNLNFLNRRVAPGKNAKKKSLCADGNSWGSVDKAWSKIVFKLLVIRYHVVIRCITIKQTFSQTVQATSDVALYNPSKFA